MNTRHKVVSLLGLCLLSAAQVQAAFIANPSFETFSAPVRADGGVVLNPGTSALTHWDVVGNQIALITPPNVWALTAADGDNFLDLTGYTNSGYPKGISQTLSGLSTGQAYRFDMDLGISNANPACRNCGGPIVVEASIGGSRQVFTHDASDAGNIWNRYGFEFLAENSSMSLRILGNSAPGIYIGLDNVTVSAVPAPAAFWCLISALVLLVRRPRRRPSKYRGTDRAAPPGVCCA